MACFNFFKTWKKIKDDQERDQRTSQTEDDREGLPNEETLIAVHVPSAKSFKLFKYVYPNVTPVTVGTAATAVKPIRTSFYEDDKVWWSYCCFGCWCRTCTGLVMNLKLDKNISLVFTLLLVTKTAKFF